VENLITRGAAFQGHDFYDRSLLHIIVDEDLLVELDMHKKVLLMTEFIDKLDKNRLNSIIFLLY
jgi:hypothetical protein